MKRINIDLFEFQAFANLAECRSFRVAAEQLGMSGPALSRLIGRLEKRLGTRLFDRDTRNVALTPQGETLRALTGRILSEAVAALSEFEGYLAARRGRVVLAGLPSVTASLLPQVIRRFLVAYPDVDVSILDALSDQVVTAVLDGRADLGFAAGWPDREDRFSFRPLLEDRFVAVGPAGGPLAEIRSYTWRELVDHPFVAMATGTSVRALTEAACVQAGFSLRPRFEVAHLATAGALVAAGLGVTALPSLTLPVLHRISLDVRPLVSPLLLRKVGMIQATGRTLPPAAAAFRAFLETYPVRDWLPEDQTDETFLAERGNQAAES